MKDFNLEPSLPLTESSIHHESPARIDLLVLLVLRAVFLVTKVCKCLCLFLSIYKGRIEAVFLAC
jgi:hypothetical protein